MTRTYNIHGMTCSGCKSAVEEGLLNIPEVSEVSIDLSQGQADVSMISPVSLSRLQSAIPQKYTILEEESSNVFNSKNADSHKEESDLKKLRPLLLIFLYISVSAVLLNRNPWDANSFMLDFMGLFYLVFSFFQPWI